MRIEELKASFEKFGELYPVLVDKNGEIIDGKHRKKVNPDWEEKVIPTTDKVTKAIIGLVANINRREITREEIEKRLGEIKKLTGWNAERIGYEIGRTKRWVLKYLPQKFKDPEKVKTLNITAEAGISVTNSVASASGERRSPTTYGNSVIQQIETNDALNEENNTGNNLEENEKYLSEGCERSNTERDCEHEGKNVVSSNRSYLFDYLEDEQYEENVWTADELRGYGEKVYGDPYFRGNTPPVIVFQCLLKYTEEGDKVLDPMAGGGTVKDICGELNRECIAFDINPLREDIKHGDAEALDLENESIDFIFAHFPYWNMISYSTDREDLSNMSVKEFLTKAGGIFHEFHRVLKPDHFCVVLIGDRRKEGLIDLSAHSSLIGSESFKLHDKIIWVAKSQRSREGRQNNLSKYRAKKHKFHLQTFDTLLIFRKKVKGTQTPL